MKRKYIAILGFIAAVLGTAIAIKKTNDNKIKELLLKDEEDDSEEDEDSFFEDELWED